VIADCIGVVAVVTPTEKLYIKSQKTQRSQIGNPDKITERKRPNILRSSTFFHVDGLCKANWQNGISVRYTEYEGVIKGGIYAGGWQIGRWEGGRSKGSSEGTTHKGVSSFVLLTKCYWDDHGTLGGEERCDWDHMGEECRKSRAWET